MRTPALLAALVAATSLAVEPPPPPPPAPAASAAAGEHGQSWLGGAGLHRARSAFVANRELAVTLRGGFFRAPQLTVPAGIDEYRSTQFAVAYSPYEWLEISGMLRSATMEQPASPAGNYWLVNDFFLKAKGSKTFANGMIALGAEVYLRLPPPIFRADPIWQGLSPGVGGLFSYDLQKAGVPLVFHVNTAIFIDQSVDFAGGTVDLTRRYALDVVTYNQWRSTVALEGRLVVGPVGVRPFLEYSADVALGAPGAPPMRLTPGVRVLPWRGLHLDALVEVGLTRVTAPGLIPLAPWHLHFAIGWQTGVDPSGVVGPAPVVERVVEREKLVAEGPTTGKVMGLVRDAATKKPLAEAVVQAPGRNRLLTEADGRYALEGLEPGPVKVVVAKAGYEPREASGLVDRGGLLTLDVALPALPPEPPKPMALRGTVLNEQEKPIVATVSVPSAGASQKSSAAGEFELAIASGEHAVEASAAGYLAQARRVTGKPGDSVVIDFVLKPVPKQTLVVLKKDKIEIKKQVHFATNRDVILPDSAPLLDQVAATLLENAQLTLIRIEGHTDDQGDDAYNLDLSNRRAKAVMRALVERGVDSGRLKAVGFGETKPIADNKKPAGRAQNRRVEFMIEEQR